MSSKTFVVLGIFDSADLLVKAVSQVKTKTRLHLEAYTPYPVEGLAELLGLRKSPVAGMVLAMGALGAVAAVLLQLWTSGLDYPLTTAGKPHFSWEAFVPIVFESTVLFAAFTAGLGALLLLNRLPMFRNPINRAKSMPLLTRDKFALAVESRGSDLDADAISKLLRQAGARGVEAIEDPGPIGPASPNFFFAAIAAIAISCIVAGLATYWTVKLFPVLPPMAHMLDQPRLNPQQSASGMRVPVPGTVMRGAVPYAIQFQEDAAALANPHPRTGETLGRGRQAYNNFCAVCHGLLGNGAPTLTAAYGAKPVNLLSRRFIEMSDGEIYHVIRMGKNAMPSYSADLAENERWAAVHYIRALQRAMNAKDEDLK